MRKNMKKENPKGRDWALVAILKRSRGAHIKNTAKQIRKTAKINLKKGKYNEL